MYSQPPQPTSKAIASTLRLDREKKFVWMIWCGFVSGIVAALTLLAIQQVQSAEADGPVLNDWPHWRGPTMNGHSAETNLPESWSPKGDNLIWRLEEYATRATPVVMNGRMYVVCRAFPETTQEGEKTVCLNAETGELIWESAHNVFLSDAPAERIGWSSVFCDTETDRVYVLGIGGMFQCLEGATGEIVWEKSMMEEYGMISPYGGRTNFPVVFEDLVIISGVMTGWGEAAVPAHRFVAFDKETGVAAWFTSTDLRPEDTTYSTPVFTVFNGQAAMVVGAADGHVYAFQPRTGKVIWKYKASTRGINTTPLVDEDGIVYCGHSERNAADTNVLGACFALDGKRTGEIKEEDLLWKHQKKTVGRAAPIKIDDRVYFVDDGGGFIIVEAKSGDIVAERKVGRANFGSPLYADGKIYYADNSGRVAILKPTEKGVDILSNVRMSDGGEVFGSPIVSNGRVYIPTNTALYCIGLADHVPAKVAAYEPPAEIPASDDDEITHIQIAPVELMLKPGQRVQMQVRGYNERGQFIKLVENATIEIDGSGAIEPNGTFTAGDVSTPAAVFIQAKLGEAVSTARARVIPDLPWHFDFNDGKVPVTWIGASYRHQPTTFEDESVLVKISTIPKGTRSQLWMGWPHLSDYTVQADVYATDKKGNDTTTMLPDMGVVAQRYTLDMRGAQKLQIRSWTPRLELRFAKTIDFSWEPKTWYTMKFQSENGDEGVTLRGKVWKKGEPEPDEWMIEATDATPNLHGSPGLFGNSTDAQFFVNNVSVVPNTK